MNSRESVDGSQDSRRLKRAICFSVALMIVEICGGLLSGSLAILTDAAHLLSDVSGFAVSLFAIEMSTWTATPSYSYGFHQAELLGALGSVMMVWAMTGVLLLEAYQRFLVPSEINGKLMFIMASVGLVVNCCLLVVLGHHHGHSHGHSHDHSHNHGACGSDFSLMDRASPQRNKALQAAFVHVVGDFIQSAGVLLAAFLIWWQPFDVGVTSTGLSRWHYADPICTVLFSILVMATTARTVKESVQILMHKSPDHIDLDCLGRDLRNVPCVVCLHDLHVWSIGSQNVVCTCHVVVASSDHADAVLKQCRDIAGDFGIGHTTIQIEIEGHFDHEREEMGTIHGRDGQCCSKATQTSQAPRVCC